MNELGLFPLTVNTVVEKRKAVEPNAFILNCRTKEAREAKHAGLDVEVFLRFRQQRSCTGHATKVLRFVRKCSVREQLLKQRKRTTYLAAFLWNPEKHTNKILLGVACSFSTRSFTHKQQLLNTNLLNAHCCCKT